MNEPKQRYVVEVDSECCPTCNQGGFWSILDTVEDMRGSTSYGDKETADDICELMNEAFEAGVEATESKRITCVVCSAALLPREQAPHCEDCIVTDEHEPDEADEPIPYTITATGRAALDAAKGNRK